jgi:undecaprenyl phosphate-alpha-L-ara4N flippase subunit ArnE
MSVLSSIAIHPWVALSSSIFLGAIGQISLKHGVTEGKSNTSKSSAMLTPWILGWAVSFALATMLWIVALKSIELSRAYPLLGLSYPLVTAMAALLLGERVSRAHWLAVGLITAGALCVARSA